MTSRPVKVFVSGAYDVLHAGHVRFLQDARKLGDYLIVCIPTDEVSRAIKHRVSYLSAAHKMLIIGELECVDEVVLGGDDPPELNFVTALHATQPDILAVTIDDKYQKAKETVCKLADVRYVQMPKTPAIDGTCATELQDKIRAPAETPARVDIGGSWLDVPKFARPRSFVVNCAITPMMSLNTPFYKSGGGVGGSAAWALLNGKPPVQAELDAGVGWQDPAVIQETGLCVWHSGALPKLAFKASGDMLDRRMLLEWTGKPHVTVDMVDYDRDFDLIDMAGAMAAAAVRTDDFHLLCKSVRLTHEAQLSEGMKTFKYMLGEVAHRYCGSGHGGYVLRIFERPIDRAYALKMNPDPIEVEPYLRGWA